MSLTLEEIAPLRGQRTVGSPATNGARSHDREPDRPLQTSRGTFLKGAVATGIGLSFATLRLFPLTEPAYAGGYDIFLDENSGPCTDYRAYLAGHYVDRCNPGCGPSPVAGGYPNGCGSGVCGECWHRCCGNLGPNGATHYLRPDECWPPDKDGWRWRCNASVLFRCHDGYACYNGGCGPTVCRINVQ